MLNVNFEAMNIEQKIEDILRRHDLKEWEIEDLKQELLNLHNVSVSLCDNPHCKDGIVDYCPYYKTPIYCQCCEQGDR